MIEIFFKGIDRTKQRIKPNGRADCSGSNGCEYLRIKWVRENSSTARLARLQRTPGIFDRLDHRCARC